MRSADFLTRTKRRARALLGVAFVAFIATAPVVRAQQPPRANLANISTRMVVGTGENALIGGLIVTGNEPKKVILRAIGPSLGNDSVGVVLQDPVLELFKGDELVASNDNWRSSQEAEIEASTIPPSDNLEAAIVAILEPNQLYTAVMRGAGDSAGVGLVEVYDLDLGADSTLANISTRGLVQTDANVMIAGSIVVGETGSSQRVLVRAIGPSLEVSGKMADPTLELVNADGAVVRANDNWRNDQEALIRASTIPPTNDAEASLVETLQPGRYTAVVRGSGESTGVAVVELYALNDDYRGVWSLAGDDPDLGSTADLEPLRWLIGDAVVAGFGESYHTSGGFYRMKHRIFRFLVEELGFRAFAMETGWEGAHLAAAYVQTGSGTVEDAIRPHINVWHGHEYADLVQWMAEWNSTHPNPEDKLTFFGFDIQEPVENAAGLVSYLEGVGIPRSDSRSAGISSCEGVEQSHPFGQVPPDRHNTCIQSLTAIEQHLTANKADLVSRTSDQDYTFALLRTVSLRAWEDQVFTIAHDRPAGYSARDAGMAYAFQVMRGLYAPNAKTMVWAANSHVARAPLVTGEVPMGSHLRDAFGERYANFALNAFVTEIDYGTCGPVQRQPDSLEDALLRILTAQNAQFMLVDTRDGSSLAHRVYATGIDQLRPHLEYDGIIYMERSPKFQPLFRAPCQ